MTLSNFCGIEKQVGTHKGVWIFLNAYGTVDKLVITRRSVFIHSYHIMVCEMFQYSPNLEKEITVVSQCFAVDFIKVQDQAAE